MTHQAVGPYSYSAKGDGQMKPQTDAVQAAAFRLLTSGFIQDTTEKSG
ncbi:hypothetical protein [Leptospira santarosai]|nr:hypothetical protein [Leptospira santarosai]